MFFNKSLSGARDYFLCPELQESTELQLLVLKELGNSFGTDAEGWRGHSDGRYIYNLVSYLEIYLVKPDRLPSPEKKAEYRNKIFIEVAEIFLTNFHKNTIFSEYISLFYVDKNGNSHENLKFPSGFMGCPEEKAESFDLNQIIKYLPTTKRLLEALTDLGMSSRDPKTQEGVRSLMARVRTKYPHIEPLIRQIKNDRRPKLETLLTGIIKGNEFVLGRFLWNYPLLKDVLDSVHIGDSKLGSAIESLRIYAKDKKTFSDELEKLLVNYAPENIISVTHS